MFFKKRAKIEDIQNALHKAGVANYVENMQVTGDAAVIVTLIMDDQIPEAENIRLNAERAVASVRGVKKAMVVMTHEREPLSMPDLKQPSKQAKIELPSVKKIIAVASGKGGVGKSTVSVNLAAALAQQGLKIGLLDADIYGPSVPMMTGLPIVKPEFENGKIVPFTAHGMKVMSLGFLVPNEAPLIWRGPMVQSAVQQLLRDVNWGDLDILIIDLPPGTGDAQLTLSQKIKLDGVVIVSTPQDISLIDARKGLEMFRKMDVPILGLIENMSYYSCPNCGHQDNIFGHGGAKDEAEKLGCKFLGEIPLNRDIREKSDQGHVFSLLEGTGIYQDIISQIKKSLFED